MPDFPSSKNSLTQDTPRKGYYKRTGLFGGTFDPIHLGHLQVAREVKAHFSLESIILIPSAQPPHKTSKIIANAPDRMEMARLAVSNQADFTVSDIELKRNGPSYSIDTISYFKHILPSDSQLYFILGLDAFLEIETWKSYRALFDQIPFIVMSRHGVGHVDIKENGKIVEAYLQGKISEGYTFSVPENRCFHKEKKPVYFFNVTPLDISSTQIRNLIKRGKSIHHMVTDSVSQHIQAQELYRT